MWEELLKRWWAGDPFTPSEEVRRYYQTKHEIIRRLRPTSICEIGVRAGYSAYAFLSAVPDAEFLGVDWGTNGPVDINEAADCCTNAARILREFPNTEMLWANSQKLRTLPKQYQFFHVDADHTYSGCSKDLQLAIASGAKWVLVDDFDVGPEVRAACRVLLLGNSEWRAEYIPDGFRGNLLLSRVL